MKPEVFYFEARGRAEIIRLTLAAAGVDFDDTRITTEKWAEFKPSTPSGQMPIVKVEDKEGKVVTIPQSLAIARHFAREHGLYGKDNWEMTLVDVVIETCKDYYDQMVKVFYENDKEKKKELLKKLYDEFNPPFLKRLMTIMQQYGGGSGYMVGNSLTLADITVYDTLTMYPGVKRLETEQKSKEQQTEQKSESKCSVNEHFNMVGAVKGIKEWVASRPDTQF